MKPRYRLHVHVIDSYRKAVMWSVQRIKAKRDPAYSTGACETSAEAVYMARLLP